MALIISTIYIFSSLIFCFNFDTTWGKCTLLNNGNSISDSELIDIIYNEINALNDLYGIIPKKQFSITITNDNSLRIMSNHWEWSLGITYTKPDRIIIKDPALSKISKTKFIKVIKHELNHLMLNRYKFYYTIPRWFKEGLAMKYADEISLNHKISIAKNLYNKNLFDIDKYKNFNHFNRQEFNFAYSLSGVYILVLEKLYGNNITQFIINDLYNGKNFEIAFYNSTGKSINEFKIISYDAIKSHFFWYKLIGLPKNIFSLMPLLLVLGFYIKSKRNKKIREQWELEEKIEDLENSINK